MDDELMDELRQVNADLAREVARGHFLKSALEREEARSHELTSVAMLRRAVTLALRAGMNQEEIRAMSGIDSRNPLYRELEDAIEEGA